MRGAALRAAAALVGALLAGCASAPRRGSSPVVELDAAHAEPEVVEREHVVAPGETLHAIGRRYGVSPEALARLNGISDPARLAAGQRLKLPDPGAPVAASAGEAGPGAEGPAAGSTAAPAGKARLEWPLLGVLYARFGPRGETVHDGIDLAAPEGTAVRAAADGRVLFAGEQRGYGHLVVLEHADGLITLYAHAGEVGVQEGATVRAGDPIARVGGPSRTSGPHLHFEVREGRTPRDPLRYLPPPR